MTFAIGAFTTKTAKEVHDDILRTVRNGMITAGISSNPQLGPGSDEDLWATAVANETQPLYANTVIKADAQMPDTAKGVAPEGQNVGADLQRLMAIVGLSPRPAVPSSGSIVLDASATTTISPGAQLIDSAGIRFEVLSSGIYAPGVVVPIIAIDVGKKTDHAEGDVLTWVAAPAYCNSKQLVGVGGLSGGADAEDNETARARYYDRLRNPPGSGNSSQVAEYAEKSTPIVQKAFVYPAVNGPSTCHVAVAGYAGAASRSRTIADAVMTGTVQPVVAGKMPEFVETVTTTVADVEADIAIGLTLPSSPAASPPGPGGGWVDGTPWPAISGTANNYANVTALDATSPTTVFTVDAPSAPQDGVSHICMVDTTDWTIKRALVLSHTGSAGAYVITIDTPFVNVAKHNLITGDLGTLIFPDSENADAYLASFIAATELMGPGEKSSNAGVLTRGFRHPIPGLSWPYSYGSQVLKQVENTGDEVTDTDYYWRSTVTPAVPVAVSDPPNILIPRRVGFYAI